MKIRTHEFHQGTNVTLCGVTVELDVINAKPAPGSVACGTCQSIIPESLVAPVLVEVERCEADTKMGDVCLSRLTEHGTCPNEFIHLGAL